MPAIEKVTATVKITHMEIVKHTTHETPNAIRHRTRIDILRALKLVGLNVSEWEIDVRT